jgi:thiol-disulfide isomerase/thioredoxin
LPQKLILFFILIIGGFSIVALFKVQEDFQNDYYQSLNDTKTLKLDSTWIKQLKYNQKKSGYFFHFTSSSCPYNDIGYESLISLYKNFNNKISFTVIVTEKEALKQVEKLIKLNGLESIKVVHDSNKNIQNTFNINSLPRAVIFNTQLELFYEGNYNHSSILCGFGNIDYGEIALNQLIKGKPAPAVDYFVLKESDCL